MSDFIPGQVAGALKSWPIMRTSIFFSLIFFICPRAEQKKIEEEALEQERLEEERKKKTEDEKEKKARLAQVKQIP